jgi:hypothetical protein
VEWMGVILRIQEKRWMVKPIEKASSLVIEMKIEVTVF